MQKKKSSPIYLLTHSPSCKKMIKINTHLREKSKPSYTHIQSNHTQYCTTLMALKEIILFFRNAEEKNHKFHKMKNLWKYFLF
jgi:hypothetical protein